MTVCLVIPPCGFMLDERVFPSLGVLKVAAALEAAGVPTRVVDLSGVPGYAAAFEAALGDEAVYGITATTPQMPAAARIASVVRRLRPGARLVLGGPHVTLLRASARREGNRPSRATAALQQLHALFDTLVCGDGERAVLLAVQPAAAPLIDADDPASPLFLTRDALSDAPLPARHLIDLASYRYAIAGHPATSLIAQLGCPFGCGFCGGRSSPFLRRVRMRPASAVVGEMRHLHAAHGYTGFMFLDDELNVNPGFLPLLQEIRAKQTIAGIEWRLRGLLKAELLTDEMAAAMHQAGFRDVLVGFESGDDRILLNMQKRSTRAQNTRAVEIARRHGLRVKALMSVGHPGETYASVMATRDWLLETAPDEFDMSLITVYAGTPYYDEATRQAHGHWTYVAPRTGDRLHARDVDQLCDTPFYKGVPGRYESFVWTDALSAHDLVALRDAVEAEVRGALGIAWPSTPAELQYEHSMGAR